MKVGTGRAVTTALVVVLGLAGPFGLAGCGGEDEPAPPKPNGVADMEPADALAASRAAMLALDDVTYRGSTTVTGQSGPLKGTGELVVTDDDSCQASFTHKKFGTLLTRTLEDEIYVRADPAMMRGPLAYDAAKVASLTDKWQVQARPSARGCHLDELLPDAGRDAAFKDAGTGEVDGVPVRRFSGKDDDGSPMTVAIATEGKPLLLAVATRRGGKSRLQLVAHNAGATVEAPPEDAVVSSR